MTGMMMSMQFVACSDDNNTTGNQTETSDSVKTQSFETATVVVKNMKVGWNLGNTMDSHSGDVNNMWIELGTSKAPKNYETAWGQPQATKALIHMFKEAGFNAIRVPVTWYPHMGISTTGLKWDISTWNPTSVDPAWMARVKEIVDYIIEEDMYCILNVHHDTGASNTGWLKASTTYYSKYKSTYENLWTEIATEFKDYDDHLLFEGYNEMLDEYNSWCFASLAAAGNYNATSAADSYTAINSYAQSFVTAVRATGGNNAERNLVVSTYGGCSGLGNWSSHLTDPLTQLTIPVDPSGNQDHIAIEIHTYLSIVNNGVFMTESAVKLQNAKQLSVLQDYLQKQKGYPVIIGEWGSTNADKEKTDYDINSTTYLAFVKDFVERCKASNIACFYWMGLSDGASRSIPQWNQTDVKDAMIKGYYGE
jgi:hypothetical protein